MSLGIHEYVFSIVFLGFSAFGAFSKVSHNENFGVAAKWGWSFLIALLLVYLIFVVVQEKDDREWSWTAPELRGLMPEKTISKYWNPPGFPPDYHNLQPVVVQSAKPAALSIRKTRAGGQWPAFGSCESAASRRAAFSRSASFQRAFDPRPEGGRLSSSQS
ncbi:MAG: hypothetical protein ACLP3K_08130 [Candidatus Acidiferrales bacterium]